MGREMDRTFKACNECSRTCCLIHGKDSSHAVSSFFKIMIGDSFSQSLFLPPKFANSALALAGRAAILEDSSGQIWRAKIHKANDSLVFQQGWSAFASDHDLQVGDFVLFFRIRELHFVVKIYDRTSCEKVNFSKKSDDDERLRKRQGRGRRIKRRRRVSDKTKCGPSVAAARDSFSDERGLRAPASSDSDVVKVDGGLEANGIAGENFAPVPSKAECVEEMDYMFGRDEGTKQGEERDWDLDLSVFEARAALDERIPRLDSSLGLLNGEGEIRENEEGKEVKNVAIYEERAIGDDNEADKEGEFDYDDECMVGENEVAKEVAVPSVARNDDKSESVSGEERVAEEVVGRAVPSAARNDENSEYVSDKGSSSRLAMPVEKNGENMPSPGMKECRIEDNKGTFSPTHILDNINQQSAQIEVNGNSQADLPTTTVTNSDQPEQIVKGIHEKTADIQSNLHKVEITEKTHVIKTKVVKKEPVETESNPGCHEHFENLCGESTKAVKTVIPRSVGMTIPEHDKVRLVVKTETVDFDEDVTTTTTTITTTRRTTKDSIKFSPFLATCGPSSIELPDILPFPIFRAKGNFERKTVHIRDPALKLWPVAYHQKQNTQFLADGWVDLCKANRIKLGDQCLFSLENESEAIYSVRVV